MPAKSRLGVSATMTANYYSGAATLTFTVDGVALNAAEISRLVKITFSWKCDYSTASEYSFACDGIFAGNPFRCGVKVDLENPALGYNRFAWK